MALTDGLVALYHMNNDWLDSSVNALNGTASGATFDEINRKLGSAAGNGDGTDDRMVVADNNLLTLAGGFTISFWGRLNSTSSGWEMMCSKYATSNKEFQISVNKDLNRMDVFVYDESAAAHIGRQWTLSDVHDDSYHLFNFTYDGGTAATGLKILVDTVQKDNATITAGTFVAIENKAAPLELFGNASLAWYAKMQMDEVVIHNRVLTSEEITEMWNCGDGMQLFSIIDNGNPVRKPAINPVPVPSKVPGFDASNNRIISRT